MRAFVAIPLPENVLEVLARVREAVIAADPAWSGEKWVPSHNLHLTVRFLGNVPSEEAAAVSSALDTAVSGVRAFPLVLSGVRAMPSPRRATMLWATFDDPERAAGALARWVSEAVSPWMAEDDSKPFRAHATLVRTRRRARVSPEALAAAESVVGVALSDASAAMSVRRVMLVSSTLTPRGPVYEEVHSAVLGD